MTVTRHVFESYIRATPDKVWEALTDPAQLHEWAPFDADTNLGKTGNAVKLTTVGAPTPLVSETRATRADPPRLLEYSGGSQDLRWELKPLGGGTRLTLWDNIDRRFIPWAPRGGTFASMSWITSSVARPSAGWWAGTHSRSAVEAVECGIRQAVRG